MFCQIVSLSESELQILKEYSIYVKDQDINIVLYLFTVFRVKLLKLRTAQLTVSCIEPELEGKKC